MLKSKIKSLVISTGLIFLSANSSSLMAKDFGVYGQTYPVVEVSFIDAIQAKMKQMVDNGEWEAHKKKYVKETVDALRRPKGHVIPHAVSTKSRLIDPSIILEMDIQLPDGSFVARKGDYINPLKQDSMDFPLIFIDGDDEKQVAWALKKRKEKPRSYIILVNGSWYELSVKHKTKFWFDQTGEFINRFEIKATPSFVEQEGLRMRIDEIGL